MSTRNRKVKDAIGSSLYIALHDLTSGPPIIRGSLTIAPGHDYWWFLEFGTGPFHEDQLSQDFVQLNPPAEVKRHEASGTAYDIEALGDDHLLVYMTKDGARRRRAATVHPGIQPLGFVRSALFDAEVFLEEDLKTLKVKVQKSRKLLKRDQLVKVINYSLELLVGTIRLNTPADTDPDPYHMDHRPHSPTLAQAWGIKRAQ